MTFKKPTNKKMNDFLGDYSKDNTRTLSIYGVETDLIKQLNDFSEEAGVSLSKMVRLCLDYAVEKEKKDPFIVPMAKKFK